MRDEPGDGAGDGQAPDWERLFADAGSPPRGQVPDLGAVVALLDGLRDAVPPNLQHQLTALARELLLTVRAVIDWQLERLEERPREPRVEDIPLDP